MRAAFLIIAKRAAGTICDSGPCALADVSE